MIKDLDDIREGAVSLCESGQGHYPQYDAVVVISLLDEIDRLRWQVKDAYMAGFMSSGDGWNGEYPFGDGAAEPEDHGKLWEQLNKWLWYFEQPVEVK